MQAVKVNGLSALWGKEVLTRFAVLVERERGRPANAVALIKDRFAEMWHGVGEEDSIEGLEEGGRQLSLIDLADSSGDHSFFNASRGK